MGQAKLRGTLSQRVAQSQEKVLEERAAFSESQRLRQIERDEQDALEDAESASRGEPIKIRKNTRRHPKSLS